MRISDWSSDVCSSDLQRCLANRLGLHAPPTVAKIAPGQEVLLNHVLHGFQVEFSGQVEDGEILVVDRLGGVGLGAVPGDEGVDEVEMGSDVPAQIHAETRADLEESGIALASRAWI